MILKVVCLVQGNCAEINYGFSDYQNVSYLCTSLNGIIKRIISLFIVWLVGVGKGTRKIIRHP